MAPIAGMFVLSIPVEVRNRILSGDCATGYLKQMARSNAASRYCFSTSQPPVASKPRLRCGQERQL